MRSEMQIIFQDPFSSLNPRMTVFDIVSEPMVIHGERNKDVLRSRVRELLEMVGLKAQHMNRYPYAFSGGQRQRLGIARALALQPKLIVADEPVSALDVSIQAQVINLLEDLQAEFGLTYVFIAHDLSVVEHISDRVAVMYLGKIVELADANILYRTRSTPTPKPCSRPCPAPIRTRRSSASFCQGDVPSPSDPPPGCHFHPRCRYAKEICSQEEPVLVEIAGQAILCRVTSPKSLSWSVSKQFSRSPLFRSRSLFLVNHGGNPHTRFGVGVSGRSDPYRTESRESVPSPGIYGGDDRAI